MAAQRRILPEDASPLRGPRPVVGRFEEPERPPCEAPRCARPQREGSDDGGCEQHALSWRYG